MPATLSEQVRVLVDLQGVDAQIYRLNLELGTIPVAKNSLEATLESSRASLKSIEDKLRAAQLKQKEFESEAMSKDVQVKKFLAQQSQVKTNQEYAALTREIKNTQADKSLIEDEALKLMEESEVLKISVQEEKKKLSADEARVKAGLAEWDKKAAELKGLLSELQAQRHKFTPQVGPELLTRYELILTKRDGIAVAVIRGESCGACGVALPPQVVNLVKIGGQLLVCESCSRILYDAG